MGRFRHDGAVNDDEMKYTRKMRLPLPLARETILLASSALGDRAVAPGLVAGEGAAAADDLPDAEPGVNLAREERRGSNLGRGKGGCEVRRRAGTSEGGCALLLGLRSRQKKGLGADRGGVRVGSVRTSAMGRSMRPAHFCLTMFTSARAPSTMPGSFARFENTSCLPSLSTAAGSFTTYSAFLAMVAL